ncbi:MAG: hypothetical protein OEW16_09310, partial [Gammaproteobacteria bacterium]|nr:hypothetical protein [Gammaproteobacteria bacterium]
QNSRATVLLIAMSPGRRWITSKGTAGATVQQTVDNSMSRGDGCGSRVVVRFSRDIGEIEVRQ